MKSVPALSVTPPSASRLGWRSGWSRSLRLVQVMLSASTARLVEGAAILAEPELVQIKGADEPVPAHRLLGIGEQHRASKAC